MKKAVFFIYIIVFHSMIARAQSPAVQKLSGDPQKDIALLLPPGTHVVTTFSRKQFSARENELSAKVMKAVLNNKAWFTDTLPHLPLEQLPDSFKKMGLTKEEFDEYTDIIQRTNQPIVTGKNTVEISKTGDIISLEYRVPYSGTMNSSKSDKNPVMKLSSGYTFNFDEGPGITPASNLQDVNFTKIEFGVGQAVNSGKTVLVFVATKIANGRTAWTDAAFIMLE